MLCWPFFFSGLPRIPLCLVLLLIFCVTSTWVLCPTLMSSPEVLFPQWFSPLPASSQPVLTAFIILFCASLQFENLTVSSLFQDIRHCMLEIVMWINQGLHKTHSINVREKKKKSSNYLMISVKWRNNNNANICITRNQELVVGWAFNTIWTGTTLLLKTWELEFSSHTAALWKKRSDPTYPISYHLSSKPDEPCPFNAAHLLWGVK